MTMLLANDATRQSGVGCGLAGHAVKVPLDAELLRLWKDVFDQSRVVTDRDPDQLSRDERPSGHEWQVGDGLPRTASFVRGASEMPFAASERTIEQGNRHGDLARPAAVERRVPVHLLAGRTVAASMPGGPTAGRELSLPHPMPVAPGAMAVPQDLHASDDPRAAWSESHACSATFDTGPVNRHAGATHDLAPIPAEAVQIYHHDGAVAIVIRDAALADEAAVRCALEAARHVAGEQRALRRVTLNGRIIFEREQCLGEAVGGQPPLSFIC